MQALHWFYNREVRESHPLNWNMLAELCGVLFFILLDLYSLRKRKTIFGSVIRKPGPKAIRDVALADDAPSRFHKDNNWKCDNDDAIRRTKSCSSFPVLASCHLLPNLLKDWLLIRFFSQRSSLPRGLWPEKINQLVNRKESQFCDFCNINGIKVKNLLGCLPILRRCKGRSKDDSLYPKSIVQKLIVWFILHWCSRFQL
ncbi:hypothetical protein VNO77_37885 [Canavalia gladiata]|uniref:Uncharacterized protein n=1 Tax=Canavalia gladiata TaxID=3824 RepID=A0AAN9PWV7_CANGL